MTITITTLFPSLKQLVTQVHLPVQFQDKEILHQEVQVKLEIRSRKELVLLVERREKELLVEEVVMKLLTEEAVANGPMEGETETNRLPRKGRRPSPLNRTVKVKRILTVIIEESLRTTFHLPLKHIHRAALRRTPRRILQLTHPFH